MNNGDMVLAGGLFLLGVIQTMGLLILSDMRKRIEKLENNQLDLFKMIIDRILPAQKQ